MPLADASCSLAIAVDVLSFVTGKAVAVRELGRVVEDDGGLVLTSLINADVAHEFAGTPLPVAAWAALLDGAPSVGFADRTVLDSYLDGWCPPPTPDDGATLEASRTVTFLAGPAALAGLGGALRGWPHAVGRLGPHPLLAPADAPAPGVRCWRRTSPSPGFDRDNADIDRYLPAELRLDARVVAAAAAGERPRALDEHVATVAVLGHSERWPKDPWNVELTER
jgi:hypothetical protein